MDHPQMEIDRQTQRQEYIATLDFVLATLDGLEADWENISKELASRHLEKAAV